jgi:ubiquinone/menaquinone biosynthesis C-methylase UbiE
MPANYDHIAPVYDLLSRVVFGRQIEAAQVCLLKFIPPHSRILIVGGGTGWILEKLAEEHGLGLKIDYVESSARMITLSRKRDIKDNTVNFINLPIEKYMSENLYDVIITPFIFDNFRLGKIQMVFDKLDARLMRGGMWLHADFVYDKKKPSLWQKLLLKIMYFFFRLTAGIETQELIAMDGYFITYLKEFEAYHYAGFIRSAVYRK